MSDPALRLPAVFALIAAALLFDLTRLAREPDYLHRSPNYIALLLHAPLFAALGLALPPKGVFGVLPCETDDS